MPSAQAAKGTPSNDKYKHLESMETTTLVASCRRLGRFLAQVVALQLQLHPNCDPQSRSQSIESNEGPCLRPLIASLVTEIPMYLHVENILVLQAQEL
jgi:hypothetical protein